MVKRSGVYAVISKRAIAPYSNRAHSLIVALTLILAIISTNFMGWIPDAMSRMPTY